MTELEQLLTQIPYSFNISCLKDTDKINSEVDAYCLTTIKWEGFAWRQIKDYFGNTLENVIKQAIQDN